MTHESADMQIAGTPTGPETAPARMTEYLTLSAGIEFHA